MIKKVFTAFFLIFLTQGTIFSQPTSDPDCQSWVDSVFNSLSTDQRIGQLFMVPVYSGGNEQHFQVVKQLIHKNNIGGLVFMEGNAMEQARLTNKFQSLSKVPLMIGMDIENGPGMQLDSVIRFPNQMTLGAIQNDTLIYQLGAEIARQMKILGVHLNFAPVADINTNPNNPMIGVRSFGDDKLNVTRKAIAYMEGLQDHGVLACAKHFPGHGDTNVDSNTALPVIEHDKERLQNIELYPFTKLFTHSVACTMVAHLHLPAFEPKNIPASLSDKIVTGLLKEDLNFDGLIFTDALNKRAVSDYYSGGEAEVQALLAGSDVLLFSENIPEAFKLIKRALKKKKIKKEDLEKSVKKILKAKYQVGLNRMKPVNTDNLYLRLNSTEARVLQREIYEQAITLVKNEDTVVPIKTLENQYFASLSIGPDENFTTSLDKYAIFSHYQKTSDDEQMLLNILANYNTVIVGIFDHDNTLNERNIGFLKQLSQTTQIIICSFNEPYDLKPLQGFRNVICAFENNEITRLVTSQILFGAKIANGTLPVSISDELIAGTGIKTRATGRLGYALPEQVGMDSKVLNKVDDIVKEAIADRATPGCQLLVAKDGKIIFEKYYGYYTYDSIEKVDDHTIYDIASITKVMATMQAFMFLEERGYFDLDKKISVYLPELKGTNKEHMILRDILTHQSGLWPYIPFWKQTVEDSAQINLYYKISPEDNFTNQVSTELYASQNVKDSVWQWVKDSKIRDKLSHIPFDYKYSDMGYYLLQRLIENTINQPMNEFLQQNFYDPMGLTTLSYLPLCRFPLSRIAPTENDNYFRQSLVYGLVHDPGAALCGGIAGHAGLFSNVIDLAKMMQMHLQDGEYGEHKYYQAGTIKKFTAQQYDNNRRGLGWDKPLRGEWYGPTSTYASPQTFGHTGFTGTAVWADPEFNLIYVFLSNRIYPEANNTKLIKNNIRTRIQDVIYQSIWSYAQYME